MSEDITKYIKEWEYFKEELIYSNRFFPKSEILDDIKGIILRREDLVEKGSTLFRAREYDLGNIFSIDDSDEGSYILGEDGSKISKKLIYSNIIDAVGTEHWSQIIKIPAYANIICERKKKSEWGFSKEGSGRPSGEKTASNRASPKYISYLYLASDIDTALAESRAQIEQHFSVAYFKTTEELKIANLTYQFFSDNSLEEDMRLITFYSSIHRAFSAPVYSNEKDYIVSQYIAEYIKSLGFAGIAFDSSRRRGGTNYTLFDDSACEFLRSELHTVEDIHIESKRLLPL